MGASLAGPWGTSLPEIILQAQFVPKRDPLGCFGYAGLFTRLA